MPQEDLGATIGGQTGGAIGGQQSDIPASLLETTVPPVPPVIPPPVTPPVTPGADVAMYRVVSQLAGTADVSAGTFAVTVNGSFNAPYTPSLVPSWPTGWYVIPADKLTTSFTARFMTAPSVDATIDWDVGGS